jgi:hypothetical protein
LSPEYGTSSGYDEANDLQKWRAAGCILKKQSQAGNMGLSSSLRVGWGANNSSCLLENITQDIGLDVFFGMT